MRTTLKLADLTSAARDLSYNDLAAFPNPSCQPVGGSGAGPRSPGLQSPPGVADNGPANHPGDRHARRRLCRGPGVRRPPSAHPPGPSGRRGGGEEDARGGGGNAVGQGG
jgi:hypothetical protein